MVDFLRLENDTEMLSAIGYKDYKSYLKQNAHKPILLLLGLFISLIFLTV